MKISLNLPPLKLLCGVSFAVFLAGCSHHQDHKQENNLVMLKPTSMPQHLHSQAKKHALFLM
ncbi:MAG: hypothetical protein J6U18_00340 [Acetobacter sp.]|nr:hypothetical protein [Acetobacter sp.]